MVESIIHEKINDSLNMGLDKLLSIMNKTKEIANNPLIQRSQNIIKDCKNKLTDFFYIRLVIMGLINVGKTSLINSLLGCDILHTSINISTNFILVIRYTDEAEPSLWNCRLSRNDLSEEAYVTTFEQSDKVAEGIDDVRKYIKDKNAAIEGAKEGNKLDESFFMILRIRIPMLEGLPSELRERVEIVDCPGLDDARSKLLDREIIMTIISCFNSFIYVTDSTKCQTKKNFSTLKKVIKRINSIKDPYCIEFMDSKVDEILKTPKKKYNIVLSKIDQGNMDEKAINQLKHYFEDLGENINLIMYSSYNELERLDFEFYLKCQYVRFPVKDLGQQGFIDEMYNKIHLLGGLLKEIKVDNELDGLPEDVTLSKNVKIGKKDLCAFYPLWKYENIMKESSDNQVAKEILDVVRNTKSQCVREITQIAKSEKLILTEFLENLITSSKSNHTSGQGVTIELDEIYNNYMDILGKYENDLNAEVRKLQTRVDQLLEKHTAVYFTQEKVNKIVDDLTTLQNKYKLALKEYERVLSQIALSYLPKLEALERSLRNNSNISDNISKNLHELNLGIEDEKGVDLDTASFVIGGLTCIGGRALLLGLVGAYFGYKFLKRSIIGFDEKQMREKIRNKFDYQIKELRDSIGLQSSEIRKHVSSVSNRFITEYFLTKVKMINETMSNGKDENIILLEDLMKEVKNLNFDNL
jgi:hypothetical protein